MADPVLFDFKQRGATAAEAPHDTIKKMVERKKIHTWSKFSLDDSEPVMDSFKSESEAEDMPSPPPW